ncbi:histidinol-phosphate aminotransferase [Palleronia marisminoris]|uniref:histidinol-phosphate transaminase n=1 Tax=Palleronia marisminoris TaxID=315423 RepID=A0A1Y5RIY8_9RHOB|nr:pyridoxal phosphate-dependent aminotransferase [Palleronia marisminoris]SFG23994.1 histidinol-phosphate aminotransferase [Palleronia marisminoris]SLN18692.1 Histidinol-phosphate aminotransferase [Palleronia marisminoris]
MTDPRLTPLAASLPATVPFVGPETQERAAGAAFRARLGANESVFGPSPTAIEAMQRAAAEAWMYPDPESHDLRQALAAHVGVGAENIVIGAGIDGLLGSLVRLTVAAGDPVVTSDGAYPTFNYHVTGYGGRLHRVPYRDDHEDPDALIEAARETGARLIYLSNPDNPMGTWHQAERIARMIEDLPDGCLLILDEAYLECSDADTSPRINTSDPRVIRMRTFSKAYGLAGCRVGYAIGDEALIGAFGRVRNHFGLSRVSQAGALAALSDEPYLREVQAKIATARDRIAGIGAENGLTALPSATNFVALDLGGDGARTRAVLDALTKARVFTRMPGVAPLDRCLRVSCGTPADLDILAEALPQALNQGRISGLT